CRGPYPLGPRHTILTRPVAPGAAAGGRIVARGICGRPHASRVLHRLHELGPSVNRGDAHRDGCDGRHLSARVRPLTGAVRTARKAL
ncbi:MAG: hypothetical protein ACRD6W_13115, partial [Nitrososphaerales archaeon]